jgi:lipid-A-disaccharide synthase
MISCGEASGDLYASALVSALADARPGLEAFGFGGSRLRRAGVDLVGDYAGFSVTGLVEAASVISKSWSMIRTLGDAARTRRPDVFVAVDFPDFNFRLLPVMHALGVPIVYYVSPQLWAWRAGRMSTLRRYVARMLVIFPFEVAIYERAGVPVEFVGHPLVDLARPVRRRDELLPAYGLDPFTPVIGLLPGSRPNEIRRILPILADAVPLIASRVPGVQFVVARVPSLADELFAPIIALRATSARIAIIEDAADDVLAASDVVVTASGTATVQTAMHGRPMVIVYRLSPLTYTVGRFFVRVPQYGMVNLIAGRQIVPELIQHAVTGEKIAGAVATLLGDPERLALMKADLAEVNQRLRSGGSSASQRAASAVMRLVTRPQLAAERLE